MQPPFNTVKLVIFDLDGTLVKPIVGNAKKPQFRAHAHDWQVMPDMLPVLGWLREEHIELAIATNQGGVAFNICHARDMKRAVDDAAYFLGIERVYMCFDHPEGNNPRWKHESEMRKPGPGMLLRAMTDAHVGPDVTLMIGDRPEDELAASNAGCNFMSIYSLLALYQLFQAMPKASQDFPF